MSALPDLKESYTGRKGFQEGSTLVRMLPKIEETIEKFGGPLHYRSPGQQQNLRDSGEDPPEKGQGS